MPKLSKSFQRIVVYGVVAIAIVGIYILLTPTTTPTAHQAYVMTSSKTEDVNTDPADDPSIHFPKYVGSGRDPFVPGVTLNNGQGSTGSLGASGKWQLTGIDTVDGVTSALVENSSTQQSEFLKVGDSWNGLRVISIGDDVVNFVNSLGLPTQLAFAAPPDPSLPAGLGSNVNVPSVNQLSPLPPLSPGFGQQSSPDFPQFGRGQ